MVDNRFSTKTAKVVSLNEGRSYYRDFISAYFLYFYNQREVLSSVFNEQNQSTAYALQLRARAREMAHMRLFIEDTYQDINVDSTRSDFIYRTFGSYLQIDQPFFFPDKSDEFYRRFVKSLFAILLKGATKQAIIQGLSIFCEGIPFEVIEAYIDPFRKTRDYLRLASFVGNVGGSSPFNFSPEVDMRNKNIFYVRFKIDQRLPGVDLDFIYKGVDFFLDIVKPAHNAYIIKWDLEDRFTLAANCQIDYDLILNEKIADTVSKDLGGLEITAKENNILVLSDATRLFVTDDTELLDSDETALFYSDFQVGDTVLYVAHNTQGRFRYARPLSEVPPTLLTSSVGYIHAPLVEDISNTLLYSPMFQMYVLKHLDAAGIEKEDKTAGICDTKKDKIYTWHYDDFRKCGAFKEQHVTLEDATDSYNSLTNTIQTLHFPITDGLGTGNLAETISVLVDSVPVLVSSVSALTGVVTLVSPVLPGSSIHISYYYSKNLAYTLNENQGLLNKSETTGLGAYATFFNEGLIDTQKKIRWKTTSFYLPGSSLLNLQYSLVENTEASPNRERLNHARVARNYETKACKIFNRTAAFGLSLEGECLNYPTPPVQLRFSAEAKLPDPWKLYAGSDILNTEGEVLNESKANKLDTDHFLLNNVFRRLVFGPFDKRYAFTDIEQSECGGSRTFYPFCDSSDFSLSVGFDDVVDGIDPDIDFIRLNDQGYVENQDLLYGVAYTGVIFKVSVTQQDAVDLFTEELDIQVNLDSLMQDTYKNPPLNIIIENDYSATPDPGTPIYGFDLLGDILNSPMLANEAGDLLNDISLVQTGTEYGEDLINIPPSRVFPGDSLDVVPAPLKETPADTNYIFHGKRTFDESVFWNLTAAFDDTYQFPTERYVLNNPPYGLNDTLFVLNPSTDMMTLN